MAVVTHGSFDEGPITLALPSVYEYAAAEETDPIFTAWDKSTGISITHDQVTDFDTAVGAIIDPYLVEFVDENPGGFATEIFVQDAIEDNTISTYAQIAETYVPYTGATTNVDLGTNTISAGRAYVDNETPISSTELATKGYVDSLAFEGTGEIVPTVAHNDTTGKEGGGGGHWYHLSAADQTIITPIVDQTAIATPSGLYVISKGISMVAGHESAYIELGWVANAETNFHHYIVFYKITGNSIWKEIVVSNDNSVLIDGLVPNTSYDFAVAAVNAGGNMTDMSTVFVAWTEADTEAPATVTGLVATGAIQAVLLRWTHNTESDLTSYNIYRNTTNSSATATKIATYQGNAFMDNGPVVAGTIGLAVDTTYYYWLKALDTSGNETVAFSTVASATTRNIIASDIVNIGASQVIIQGVTTLASWVSPGVTTIDGDKITTGTVTLTKLNFTPALSNNIVATINASTEGIEIDADLFRVNGTTIFAAGVPSTGLSRVYIYPNSTQGIRVTNDVGGNVFVVEVGGTNVGDVTIGNYAGGQGMLFDRSAGSGVGSLTIRGAIYASSGSISGVLDFGTATATFGGRSSNIAIQGCHIWENAYDGDNSQIAVNYNGFAGGTTHYRSFVVYNGKQRPLLSVGHVVSGVAQDVVEVIGKLVMTPYSGVGYFMPPILTTTEMLAISGANRSAGMIVYNSTLGAFCGVVNDGGVERWWTFGMNARIG